jgi:hypothetical protein
MRGCWLDAGQGAEDPDLGDLRALGGVLPDLRVAQVRGVLADHRWRSLAITALLLEPGPPGRGVELGLLEQAAGQPTWRLAARAGTEAGGSAILTVPHLTVNASFLVTGPDGRASEPLTIVVSPVVSLHVLADPRGRPDVLSASCRFAGRGDTAELQVLAGRWRAVRSRRLGKGERATFAAAVRAVSASYRVALRATAEHGQAVSRVVTVAPHGRLSKW